MENDWANCWNISGGPARCLIFGLLPSCVVQIWSVSLQLQLNWYQDPFLVLWYLLQVEGSLEMGLMRSLNGIWSQGLISLYQSWPLGYPFLIHTTVKMCPQIYLYWRNQTLVLNSGYWDHLHSAMMECYLPTGFQQASSHLFHPESDVKKLESESESYSRTYL